MNPFYDALETRDPSAREAALLAALPPQVAHARAASPAFASILADTDPAAITSRAALARLPVTRKYELLERQQAGRADNAFGGFAAIGFGAAMPRVFCSPGPIYEPEGVRRDYWRMARALYAAGFRAGELVAQQLQLPLRAGRLDDGKRRPCAGLHRLPRRHRPNRAAGAGDRASCAPQATSAHPAFSS